MTAARIRLAGKAEQVRQRAIAGESFKAIADWLKAEGVQGVNSTSVRRLLGQEADDRREAATAVATDEATQSTRLVVDTLRDLVSQGAELSKTAHATGESGAWAQAARVTVIACEVLEKVTLGAKPATVPLSIEQLRERVRLLYGIDEDGEEPADESPRVH